MKRDSSDPTRALIPDLLAPEGYGETRRSQREDGWRRFWPASASTICRKKRSLVSRHAPLRGRPHSASVMASERIVAWICGLQHVRETIPFWAAVRSC